MGIEGASSKATPAEAYALPAEKFGNVTELYTQTYQHSHNSFKRVGRYLLNTSEKGIVLHPNSEITIDCHLDPDFAGMWNREDHDMIIVSRVKLYMSYALVIYHY